MHTTATITQAEAARRLGISGPGLAALISRGLISTAETADGLRLVPASEVERYKAERRRPGRPSGQ